MGNDVYQTQVVRDYVYSSSEASTRFEDDDDVAVETRKTNNRREGILVKFMNTILPNRNKSSTSLLALISDDDSSVNTDLEQTSICSQTPTLIYKELNKANNHFRDLEQTSICSQTPTLIYKELNKANNHFRDLERESRSIYFQRSTRKSSTIFKNKSSTSLALISDDPSINTDLEKGSFYHSPGFEHGSIPRSPGLEHGSIYFQGSISIFAYNELDQATNHFDSRRKLGDGGRSSVYHGRLHDGRVAAVKRLLEHRDKPFMNEIEILSRLGHHQNLVSIYGRSTRHSWELLLVYEYAPNGTLTDHLHGDRASDGCLTWPLRLSIAIELADALAYLHAFDVIHHNITTDNVLLDNDFHVKLAGFGLSSLFPVGVTDVSTPPRGTPGYVVQEYYSDVYSFGVVLIELISSKPAVDTGRQHHQINLADMARDSIHNGVLRELIDPNLGFDSDDSTRKMITLVAELAFRCLQQEEEMRPCMTEVLETLKGKSTRKWLRTEWIY